MTWISFAEDFLGSLLTACCCLWQSVAGDQYEPLRVWSFMCKIGWKGLSSFRKESSWSENCSTCRQWQKLYSRPQRSSTLIINCFALRFGGSTSLFGCLWSSYFWDVWSFLLLEEHCPNFWFRCRYSGIHCSGEVWLLYTGNHHPRFCDSPASAGGLRLQAHVW